jgi:hypothetical protein
MEKNLMNLKKILLPIVLGASFPLGERVDSFLDTALSARHPTQVSIQGTSFRINGQPTYERRYWNGQKIEGLLFNSRMVQGIFDDRNPETSVRWAYPDSGRWDPERNTNEFLAAMPEWRKRGLLAFTINFQGGSPEGYSKLQPWNNSAFSGEGILDAAYASRMRRILDRADALGMVAIVGYFYFGQDQRLKDENAILRATDQATDWILQGGWRNVLVEIDNECNITAYDHSILKNPRIHELIERVKKKIYRGRRLLVSTSYGGGFIPESKVVQAADFLLLHGNGVKEPERIRQMVQKTRQVAGYSPKPILFNEDDHFDFDLPQNNFLAAVEEYASWGFFDYRMSGEGFDEGYQSIPVNWSLSSKRKRDFFRLLATITDSHVKLGG